MATKTKAAKSRPKIKPRSKAGRPAKDRGSYGQLTTLTVRVDRRTRAMLAKLGEGSASAGIRILARAYGPLAIANEKGS